MGGVNLSGVFGGEMPAVFCAFLTAFLIVFLGIPSIIKVAHLKGLFALTPRDGRGGHKIPTLGGIALFAGFSISMLFWGDFVYLQEFHYFLCSLLILFFIGVKDDILLVPYHKKLAIQAMAAILIVCWGDVRLTGLHGLFQIEDTPLWSSYLLSITAVLGITNSFNLIDGIDTLACGLGLLAMGFFLLCFLLIGGPGEAAIAASMAGGLAGLLYYNRSPAKIFMGDTGSLILGFTAAILAIKFIEARPAVFITGSPTLAIAALSIPMYDTIYTFFRRIINRKNPFTPDKEHLHHKLIRLGLSHVNASKLLISLNTSILAFAYSFLGPIGWDEEAVLVIIVLIMSIFNIFLYRLSYKKGIDTYLPQKIRI